MAVVLYLTFLVVQDLTLITKNIHFTKELEYYVPFQ
jgi:hypothetical protein